MSKFNLKLFKEGGRKRIKDRHIRWKETYRERSAPLKKRYDKNIGPKSYYRFEGHDYTTGSDYFIVVGPAKTKYDEKMFFSGIRKLPARWETKKQYSPSGKYFTNILAALRHAVQKWGLSFPQDQINYTREDLAPIEISRHIKG
jgi:hypothetical protein